MVAREWELSVRGAAVKGTGHQNRLSAFAREHPVCARPALTPPSEVKPRQGRQKLAAIRCGVCAQRPASLPGRLGDEKTPAPRRLPGSLIGLDYAASDSLPRASRHEFTKAMTSGVG